MARRSDRILVCAYVALAALPALAMAVGAPDLPVKGSVARVELAAPTVGGVFDESFQGRFTGWFESELGGKGIAIHADNTVLYHVFGETKPDARVKIGRDRQLFELDDLWYLSNRAEDLWRPGEAAAFADRVATLQAALAAEGRGFVPVIVPSKTSIYRAEVPEGWVLPGPSPTDHSVYRTVTAAFDARGVRYVDARKLLTELNEPRDRIWGRDARHWSAYAACLVIRDVLVAHATLTATPRIEYTCTPEVHAGARDGHPDLDLWRLLNAWAVPRIDAVTEVAAPAHVPTGALPSALFAGCSFSWTLVRDAHRSQAFRDLTLHYCHDNSFIAVPANVATTPDPGTAAWRAAALGKDLYVLDLTESYLDAHSWGVAFVDQLAAARATR